MSLIITKKEIPLLHEGIYTGVCYAVIDLGEQYDEWHDKYNRKLMLMWEIPDETFELGGKEVTRTISEIYTASLNEKSNLRKALESWRGKALTAEEQAKFNASDMIGCGCSLQIIHRTKGEKIYPNIASIMSLKKNEETPKATIEPIIFDLDDETTHDAYERLPSFAKRILEKAYDSYKCGKIGQDEPEQAKTA